MAAPPLSSSPPAEPAARPRRAASGAGVVLAVVIASAAVVAKVAVDAGAPPRLLAALVVAAVAALGVVAADPARRRGLDGPRALLAGLALVMLPTVYGEVGGDGLQAFVVVRSVLLDHDLDLADDYAGMGVRPVATATGQATSHLPIGLALLWAPAFLLAHAGTALAAALGADVRADGFSVPYRSAVTAATCVYGVLALLLIEGELRRRHGRAVAVLAVLAIWLATPVHFYMTANPAMAHGASIFAATAFVVAWLRVRSGDGAGAWAVVGLLGGLMTLVRLQDAVLLALPALDLALRRPPAWTGRLARFLGAAATAGLVQLAVWLRLYGTAFLSTVLAVNLVGGTGPHVIGVLFSARHGLFYWTPIYAACVVGWLLWARRERLLALLALAGFAGAVIVNGSLQDWWGSEAFGQRRLLGLTPLFALGLAEVLAALPRRSRPAAGAVLALLALGNVSFEGIYNSGVAAPRDQAITYRALAHAQRDALRRKVVALDRRLPESLWTRAYDAVGGTWLDEGRRSLGGRVDLGAEPPDMPFLIGRGWYDPQAEGGVSFRRSRGRGSWLRVPLRATAGADIVVRLRPEVHEAPTRITFEVNRQPVGTAELVPGWSEYTFAVPSRLLRRGLNDLGLIYAATPREADPAYAGRNAAVAVDWLELRRPHDQRR